MGAPGAGAQAQQLTAPTNGPRPPLEAWTFEEPLLSISTLFTATPRAAHEVTLSSQFVLHTVP